MKTNNQRDDKGIVVCLIFIAISLLSIWDTTTMVDSDSYVFPRTIAIVMIALSVIFIVWQFIRPNTTQTDEQLTEGGSTFRRVALVLGMFIPVLLMPMIGFVLSGLLIFIGLMFISMYDQWNKKNLSIFLILSLVIVIGFYLLFKEVLSVPLPLGDWFDN